MKICCFAGHSNIYDNQEKLKFNLKNEIIKLIEKEKVNIFYCGGKGAFDWLCAKVINELKQDHPFIKSYVIHDWGGAAKTVEFAKKQKNIKIINLNMNI